MVDPSMAVTDQVITSGWLEKKGGMIWSKRFFVLAKARDSATASLFYFREPPESTADVAGDAAVKGCVAMTWGTKVDVLSGKPHAFQVILAKRALKVAAASAEERAAPAKETFFPRTPRIF